MEAIKMFKTKEKFDEKLCYGDEKCRAEKRKKFGGKICRYGRRDIK